MRHVSVGRTLIISLSFPLHLLRILANLISWLSWKCADSEGKRLLKGVLRDQAHCKCRVKINVICAEVCRSCDSCDRCSAAADCMVVQCPSVTGCVILSSFICAQKKA